MAGAYLASPLGAIVMVSALVPAFSLGGLMICLTFASMSYNISEVNGWTHGYTTVVFGSLFIAFCSFAIANAEQESKPARKLS